MSRNIPLLTGDAGIRLKVYNQEVHPSERIDLSGNIDEITFCARNDNRLTYFASYEPAPISNDDELISLKTELRMAFVTWIKSVLFGCDGNLDDLSEVNLKFVFGDQVKGYEAILTHYAANLIKLFFGEVTGGAQIETSLFSTTKQTIEIEAEMFLKPSLRAKLDIRDAKQLVDILYWTNQFIGADVERVTTGLTSLAYNLGFGHLLEFHRYDIYEWVGVTTDNLIRSRIGITAKDWDDFIATNSLTDKISSKDELIQLIQRKGNNMRLTMHDFSKSAKALIYGKVTLFVKTEPPREEAKQASGLFNQLTKGF